jgi:hypothetical protein
MQELESVSQRLLFRRIGCALCLLPGAGLDDQLIRKRETFHEVVKKSEQNGLWANRSQSF